MLTSCDVDGTIIPFADLDELTELEILDPEGGAPETWPSWTDDDVWEPGPAIPAGAAIVPPELEPDGEWHSEPEGYEPSDEDRADYERWLDRLNTLTRLADMDAAYDRLAGGWVGTDRMTDDDVRTATGAVG